jgi:hypothetical protein
MEKEGERERGEGERGGEGIDRRMEEELDVSPPTPFCSVWGKHRHRHIGNVMWVLKTCTGANGTDTTHKPD